MSLILIFKLVIVLIFLIQFLRRPSLPWGVGLLTVTSALLLDTILGTFDTELMRAELGFFYYVIIGFLLAGAAYWLLALLWPTLQREKNEEDVAVTAVAPTTPSPNTNPTDPTPSFNQVTAENGMVVDLQSIYQDLAAKFGPEDRLDLMFDLNMTQNEVSANANGSQDLLAAEIVTYAEQNQQVGALALAVERILHPPAPETLPRLEKISPTSPRPILRCYLLAHYDLSQLQETAVALNIPWLQLAGNNKHAKTRELLTYLYQHNQIQALLTYLQTHKVEPTEAVDDN